MTEDLSIFFTDFGVDAVCGVDSGRVLLDRPDISALNGMMIAEDAFITFPADTFPSVVSDVAITVDGKAYTVREVFALGDGAMKRATLKGA